MAARRRSWIARLIAAQRRELRRAGTSYSGRAFGIPLLVLSASMAAAGVALLAVPSGPHWGFATLMLINAVLSGWFGFVVYGYDRDTGGDRGGDDRV